MLAKNWTGFQRVKTLNGDNYCAADLLPDARQAAGDPNHLQALGTAHSASCRTATNWMTDQLSRRPSPLAITA